MKIKTLLFGFAAAVLGTFAQAEAVEGKDYIVRSQIVEPRAGSDKIEVAEFFSYTCPHCKNLEPLIQRAARRFADDTVLRTEHVVWSPAQQPFARIAAAIEDAGLKREANMPVFRAVIEQNTLLSDENVFRAWAGEQTFGAALLTAYGKPKVAERAAEMETLTNRYRIEHTPVVVVGGKYELTFANGFEAGMKTLEELVVKVRRERGLPEPAAKPAVVFRGAAFAVEAGR